MRKIPALLCDFYKLGHKDQYPKGIEKVYSTWTPRSNRHYPALDKVVVFGVQGMLQELMQTFHAFFFNANLADLENQYKSYMQGCLGVESASFSHLQQLWSYGDLPIRVKALPEGTVVKPGVPVLTIENTEPEFFWVTNFLETYLSAQLWKPMTVASIARKYRQILDKYAEETSDCPEFVDFQAHDFSMRGMSGVEDAARSSAGHLLYFKGTDTIPAISYLRQYYGTGFVAGSVPATEHSVMCAGGKDDEYETYRRLIEDVHPAGVVSIVSDTWDLWKVVDETLPALKDKIMARDGKVVIRPDSGDPVGILCGDPDGKTETERDGLIARLYSLFGGHRNSKGYIELDSHIGAIYGDSITLERCEAICKRLQAKGFASTNVVFGVGSFTYQYITRDSLGFAMKATSVVINGEKKAIFKDPKTDNGDKKSQYGEVKVYLEDGELKAADEKTEGFENIADEMRVALYFGQLSSTPFEDIVYRAKA